MHFQGCNRITFLFCHTWDFKQVLPLCEHHMIRLNLIAVGETEMKHSDVQNSHWNGEQSCCATVEETSIFGTERYLYVLSFSN